LGESKVIYNSIGEVETSIDRYGYPTVSIYDAQGEGIQTTFPDGTVSRSTILYGYGDNAEKSATIVEDPHFEGDPVYGTRTEYDEIGRPIKNERLANFRITISGDALSSFSDFEELSGGVQVLSTTTTHYNDAGNVDAETDARGNTTTYTYDGYDRIETVTKWVTTPASRDQTVTTSHYDDNGNLEGVTVVVTKFTLANPPVQIGAPITVPTQSCQYDSLRRRWLTVHEDNSFSRVIFDSLGRVAEEIDQDGVSTRSEYDGEGRVTAVTKPYKIYDPTQLNNHDAPPVLDANPADQTVTRFAYNLAGQLVTQTDGNQTVLAPANQKHTLFAYDKLGRIISRTLPETQPESWVYDATVAGHLVRRVVHSDFNGTVITDDFDPMGRILTRTPTSASLPPEGKVPVSLTYTATGKPKTISDASGLSEYLYDNRDRLWKKTVEKSTPNERTLTYLYNDNDLVETISSSSGQTALNYQYDELNRLKSANGTSYTYDPPGNLETVTYPSPNSAVTAYHYDVSQRLVYMTLNNGSAQLLASFEYDDYAATDKPVWQTERKLTRSGLRQGAAELVKYNVQDHRRLMAYDYDRLNRLGAERIRTATGASWPAWPSPTLPASPSTGDILYDTLPGYSDLPGHGYDRTGNRSSRSVSDSSLIAKGVTPVSSQAFDADDRLLGGNNAYDANGNTLVGNLLGLPGEVDPLPGPTTQDVYDYANRLIKRSNGSTTVNLVYDAAGNRVRKTIVSGNTTVIRYLVDDLNPTGYAQVLEEWRSVNGGASTLDRAYVYGHSLISQRQSDDTVQYYGYDGHGNVRLLLNNDATAAVSDAYDYDAFGILINEWHQNAVTPTPNHYLYSGEQWDSELGMYYLRARYLNPQNGRFWSMDTYGGDQGNPSSLHKYTYAFCDPVNNLDSSGNFPGGHHKVPQSLWDERDKEFHFSEDAKEFFDSDPAKVNTPNGHNFTNPHGSYNKNMRAEVREWLKKEGIKPGDMTKKDCARMIKDIEKKNKFIREFNLIVRKGPEKVKSWLKSKGYKLIPVEFQSAALKKALAAKAAKRLGGALARKVPLIGYGFTILMAEQMKAEGATDRQIAKAVVNDFFWNVPEMAEAGADVVWNQAVYVAEGAMAGAFSYLNYDYDESPADGGNGLLVSEQAVNDILKRGNVTAGSLIQVW
jgi:RHS repeat-associated protein